MVENYFQSQPPAEHGATALTDWCQRRRKRPLSETIENKRVLVSIASHYTRALIVGDVRPAAPLMNIHITEQTMANKKQEAHSRHSLFTSPIYWYLDLFSELQ